jgi:HPt (histidine-containing phosphotransfer) domain-containing protein
VGQRPTRVNETILASEVFDRLQEAMASDRAGLTELYRDFLADGWQTLRTLRDAVQQKQAEEVVGRAHYLKSSSLVLGARVVAQCAARLEEMGRNADLTVAEATLGRTWQAMQEIQTELSERLGAGVLPPGQVAA